MLTDERTLSLADFRANTRETLKRLKTTGDVEILTDEGEAGGVVMSPETYDQLMRDWFSGSGYRGHS